VVVIFALVFSTLVGVVFGLYRAARAASLDRLTTWKDQWSRRVRATRDA